MLRRELPDEGVNPYIAFSDLVLNVLFILIFFVAAVLAVGQVGWEQVRYRDSQKVVKDAIDGTPLPIRPVVLPNEARRDPPGAQRWVFTTVGPYPMFAPGTAEVTPEGRAALARFAQALRDEKRKEPLVWRRVRIEGHAQALRPGQFESWSLSAERAAAAAAVFVKDGGIEPHFLAVSARGSQTPRNGRTPGAPVVYDARDDRVEIVVEYAQNVREP